MAEQTSSPSPASRRRTLLMLAGLAAVPLVWQEVPALWQRIVPPDFDFEPLADPAGFRRLGGGAVSGGFDPLIGIGTAPRPAAPVVDPAALRADLCTALFGRDPAPGLVPIASFSDYYCPFCRVLTGWLAAMEAEADAGITIHWHEWPILGATSEVAARAGLAAKRQDAYLAFHTALMRGGFVPTPAFLHDLALRLAIDHGQMLADMESAEIAREIAVTRALSNLFGFAGTPALVVGRTVVVGQIDQATLRALIARERADGPMTGCG